MSSNLPTIGITTAFTGKYLASKFLIRFLELLNFPIIKSTKTKPNIIQAGSTVASADFCLPLRAYIGHIYYLIQEQELDYILAPIIKGERPSSSTCAKYRDLDGVIIRTLGNISGYRLNQSRRDSADNIEQLKKLIGQPLVDRLLSSANKLPQILAPEIESLDKAHLRQISKRVYRQLAGLSFSHTINGAFEQAYSEVIEKRSKRYHSFLKDEDKIRLAIVGRNYLVDDPALSADVKAYFLKKGVSVITLSDLPFEEIEDKYHEVEGFYDTHKTGKAFIDTVKDDVDGFIVVGSFGCHPDAFQVDYFAQYIAEHGKACWTFKFDEQAGGVGFQTRYETIMGFLQQKRNERISKKKTDLYAEHQLFDFKTNVKKHNNETREPIFIWPYMGDGLNLMLEELCYKFGLQDNIFPPLPVNEETIEKGNNHYTETCSPFALSIGSIKQTLERLFSEFEKEAEQSYSRVKPRRIIILMARGKGPCTFGWYAIAGHYVLKEEYASYLQKYGHTIEMFALDNQGRNLKSFLSDLASTAKNNRIAKLLNEMNELEGKCILQSKKIEFNLLKQLKKIVEPGWHKLLAYEELQNKALTVRAHELERGSTTRQLREWINELEHAHDLKEIDEIKSIALKNIENISKDNEHKPKIVVVGEIYVSLTSFANRGTVDNLLGLAGIEAVEGMRLSYFISGAFKSLKMNFIQNQPIIKSILPFLDSMNLYHHERWVREPFAKPFLEHEIGGDGQPTIAHTRHHIENDGVDGIIHIYPFKCMPEGMAKDALKEMSQIYGVKSLHLSFDKETEIERLKTEINTFAELLHQEKETKASSYKIEQEILRRQRIGKIIERAYKQSKKTV